MTLFDRPRTDWERTGYTVAQHTSSRPVDWRRVRYAVLHYTAAKRPGQAPDYIAAMQRAYVTGRGYSLGYSVVVDQHGVAWQVRGEEYMPAANAEVNKESFAILLLVDGDNPASPVMVERTRQIIAAVRGLASQTVAIVGHRDVGKTACPGGGIYTQITTGAFEPRNEELTMRIINPPTRTYDSRKQGGAFKNGETRRVTVGKNTAAFVNVTVVDAAGGGFITMWGDGPMPDVSNLNYATGQTICNTSWVPVNLDGTINVYASAGCHVLVDVQAVA